MKILVLAISLVDLVVGVKFLSWNGSAVVIYGMLRTLIDGGGFGIVALHQI
jgi:hypothetical protein